MKQHGKSVLLHFLLQPRCLVVQTVGFSEEIGCHYCSCKSDNACHVKPWLTLVIRTLTITDSWTALIYLLFQESVRFNILLSDFVTNKTPTILRLWGFFRWFDLDGLWSGGSAGCNNGLFSELRPAGRWDAKRPGNKVGSMNPMISASFPCGG
jgi:hypothetical protein